MVPGLDEYFRGIYTRAAVGFGSEVLAISSAIGGEGKTTLSVGLAITLAQDFPERRVLLVETDFQSPVLAADLVEPFDERHAVQFLAVERRRSALLELDLDILRLVRRPCGRRRLA